MSGLRAQNAGEMALTQGKNMSRMAVVVVVRTHVVIRLVPSRKIGLKAKRNTQKNILQNQKLM
jgi:hypothetical protein